MTAPLVIELQPLVDEISSRVAALGVPFGDGHEPDRVDNNPWVVGWFDAGTYAARSLIGGDAWSTVGTFHCCGLTPESARVAVRRLTEVIKGLHLAVVDGRQVQMPQQLTASPLDRDDDADPPVYLQAVEWRLRTSPA